MSTSSIHESWTSRAAYILAAVGATVGLGNLWRFPFEAGENGGGLFVLIYLFAVFFLVSPLFMAETLIGRVGQRSAPNSFAELGKKFAGTHAWKLVGFSGILITFLVLSFFSVIAGFSIGYALKALTGTFNNPDPAYIAGIWQDFRGNPWTLLLWHSVIALSTGLVVGRGIRRGIEKTARVLMPALLLILIFLVGYAAFIGDVGAAASYLFAFNTEALTPGVALAAFGQAFFTMSVGSCGMLTYAAYVGKKIPIAKTTATIALGDTLVALLAGFAIFPIVFGFGLDPAEGAELVFVTLPIAFAQIPFGNVVAFLFFVLFIFAAVTSTIALLETIVSYLEEKGWAPRLPSALLASGVFWAIGILSVLSFNVWGSAAPLGFIPGLQGMNPFALINGLVGEILLPVTGILISVFAGWVIPKAVSVEELGLGKRIYFNIWVFIVRFVAPILVGTLLVTTLFFGD